MEKKNNKIKLKKIKNKTPGPGGFQRLLHGDSARKPSADSTFLGLFIRTHNLKIHLPKAPQLAHVERRPGGKDGLCSRPSGGMLLAGRIPHQPSSVFRDWFFGFIGESWALMWEVDKSSESV
ncbi:unnamed protein product [Rangifer tarandus platyrhynchus]|uniref:Uncharacterized protein n=1 Tax=Rangifer tarandus platyrhynchus TaxID=3082113 RepID=A0ABN8ZVC1_RANTA|nr:unnamed protein product [Rangifer tarandus platyrhynchus]